MDETCPAVRETLRVGSDSVQASRADFAEADLTKGVLEHCDLSGAIFDHSILEKARKVPFFLGGSCAMISPELHRTSYSVNGVAVSQRQAFWFQISSSSRNALFSRGPKAFILKNI
jgi:hypothetical protein